MSGQVEQKESTEEEVTDRVFTVANVITFIRLCMTPVVLVLILCGQDIAATVVFSVTAATDFVDGQVARRTHTVSRIGQLLDPTVDHCSLSADCPCGSSYLCWLATRCCCSAAAGC